MSSKRSVFRLFDDDEAASVKLVLHAHRDVPPGAIHFSLPVDQSLPESALEILGEQRILQLVPRIDGIGVDDP